MPFLSFEKLRVFKLAVEVADHIWEIVNNWKIFEKDTIGKQLVKAADSVGANIAEGAGRGTKKDNQRFVRIARGSFNETKYWLQRAYRRNLIQENQRKKIATLLEELGPTLNAYLKSIGRSGR